MIQIKTTWGFNEKTEICVRDWGDKTELKELKVVASRKLDGWDERKP